MDIDLQKTLDFLRLSNIEIQTKNHYLDISPVPIICQQTVDIRPTKTSEEFLDVLGRRRSSRTFQSVNSEKLLSVLAESARVIDISTAEDGHIRSYRPYASAGGRHPLEIYCVANQVNGIQSGIWYFDPFKLCMQLSSAPLACRNDVISNAEKLIGSKPAAVLIIAAVLNRTLTRYKNGLSLIWKDTGNLSATISLACTSYGLNSCQLGLSEEFLWHTYFQTEMQPVWITGGIALG